MEEVLIRRCQFMQGERNPRWNGGTSQYQDHYYFKKARIVKLTQTDYKCEVCGNPAKVVHHKDGTTSNHQLDNLQSLCQKCHIKIHAEKNNYRKTTSKFRRLYGMSLKEMAMKLGTYEATILKLHDKGKLKTFLLSGSLPTKKVRSAREKGRYKIDAEYF